MNPKARFNLAYLIFAFFLIVCFTRGGPIYSSAHIPFSEFQTLLEGNKISEVVINDNQIIGKLKDPQGSEKKQFATNRVEPDIAKLLDAHGVKYSRVIQNGFFKDLLSWVVPVFVFFGLWLLLMRRMGGGRGGMGGFMSVGQSKAKIYVEKDTKVTFKDVAGVEEAKEELKEIVDFLKDPKSYGRLGARVPKGILLVGPPGTGKTLFAKAVAGEAGVPFFSISGSEFVEMFVGVGAARVRDLFEQARKKAPCIIFIDELDALGRARSVGGFSAGNDEKEQTLNQLLVELDGFDSSTGIIVLSATNRPEILDPALLRAGRFDRQILVDRPDKKGRVEILKVHSGKVKLDPGTSLEQVAALTPGFTGADLANLVNEAALVATRRKAEQINLSDFTAAIERMVAGLEKKNRLLNPEERKVVAYHEMGHALVAGCLPSADPVHKVSIIPRGMGALGYTLQRPAEDRYLMTLEELGNKMAVLLGGRAAEKLIFNHFSTGAADDIARATDIARSMATRYGMESSLGSVSYDSETGGYLGGAGAVNPFQYRRYSEETAREIDLSVKERVNQALLRAVTLIDANRGILEQGAQQLLEKETLVEEDLKTLFATLKREST
ncbi:ATP-dependent metallopeptidase FtsH/Yme1/Tma family protein [bacterium]|nr:ATP-dependent metallopeptidase FtsH/Yme1/Tma family protein [bacterium]